MFQDRRSDEIGMVCRFDGLVLCQYNHRSSGKVKDFYTRVVVTCWGVLICIAFDLFFPW